MTVPERPLVIAGGGLAGGLAAVALARHRPDVPLLLIEQGELFGGNHVWSFFDSDVESRHRAMVEELAPSRWPDHAVRFPKRLRTLGFGYNSVRSAGLDALVRAALRPDQMILEQAITRLEPDHVILDDDRRIEALGVIDARGPGPTSGLDLAWQKFVGRSYRFARPHGVERPTIMDGTVDQRDGYRFVYTLPFSPTEMLVEDTYYSTSPVLDHDALSGGIDAIAAAAGEVEQVIGEETGVLPVVLGGEVEALWRDAAVPLLGLRGGFFHPTTGYSLPDAVRNAALLVTLRDFSTAALHARFRREAERLWTERKFFQLLNRMLFHAAEPAQRYRVLEHFYRLPEPVIARFYAARLTLLDKARILSGRPPVALGRALSAMRRRAA